jgi:membrane fusion protein (multidrug efflux system)
MAKTADGESTPAYRPGTAEPVIERAAPRKVADATPKDKVENQPSTPRDAPADEKPARQLPIRRLVLLAVGIIAAVAIVYYGVHWLTVGRFMVSTDDAYVSADTSTITAKVAGYVQSVPAQDNTRVKAGDPLVVLDDADFRNSLAQAQAQVATGEATVERLSQQIIAANAAVNSAKAQVASAQAAADNDKASFDRTKALAASSFASNAALDAARTAMQQATAAVDVANAAVTSAEANSGVAAASKTEAERALDQYRVALNQAQLNLDHAVIRAPFDGVTGNGAAQPGEYVSPGQRLLALVPLDEVYVDANFKETQLQELVVGQTAHVSVDAFPGVTIDGAVESVSPASGAVFSLLPPENATGNFTKVVQRVAVRIRLPRDVAEKGLIRPGMSVVATVDTRTGPSHVATLAN